ncbi:MAG: CBS domain-containing protein [Gemmataceae bacterium]|nr:CBS domain-containing protein [Gemmataceae bacterium]
MATVSDILAIKGAEERAVGPEETVYEAAVKMNENKIGSLAVMQEGRLCGIITERDILQRVVADRRDPATTTVGEVMTTDLVCCRSHTPLEEARGVMKNRRIRHLPVVDDQGQLRGMVSIGDLNAHQATTQERTIHLLHEYIYGHA